MLEDHRIPASINRIWPALNFPVTRLPWYFSNSCRINISAEQATWNPHEPTFGACHGIHGKLEVWWCCQIASALTSIQEPHSPATHAWWRECVWMFMDTYTDLSPLPLSLSPFTSSLSCSRAQTGTEHLLWASRGGAEGTRSMAEAGSRDLLSVCWEAAQLDTHAASASLGI